MPLPLADFFFSDVQDIAAAAREQSAYTEEISAAGESLRSLAERLSKE